MVTYACTDSIQKSLYALYSCVVASFSLSTLDALPFITGKFASADKCTTSHVVDADTQLGAVWFGLARVVFPSLL